MEYRGFGPAYIVRIDRGEEIVSQVKQVCDQEGIKLGTITGLGAVERAVIGMFDVDTKTYHSTTMSGAFDITSLHGNITTMEGEVYLHVYAILAGADNRTFGGHLNEAIVSTSCELFIQTVDGHVDRVFDKTTGLNRLEFS